MRQFIKFILLICLIQLVISCHADTNGNIQLSVTRQNIPADGKSITTVNAIVRDSDGNLVVDDTEVKFNASLGIIEESAFTSSGVARVKLTSSEISGKSIITASWLEGKAVSQITVNFVSGSVKEIERKYITVKADHYMAYAIDMKVMDASGGASVELNNVTINAHTIQIDLLKNRITAQGLGSEKPVKISVGEKIIECEMFSVDISGTYGLMISAARGGIESINFTDSELKTEKTDNIYSSDMFEIFDTEGSLIHVESKQAIIFPGEKIYFKNAGISPGGKKLFKLPYYSLSLSGYQQEGAQYFGYSSNGISLSLPYHYSLTPSSNGALLLKYGERSGWSGYGQVPGWFIDLRHEYNSAKSNGVLTFNEITSNDWGIHYSHNQSIGEKTNANIYIDYPSHEDLFTNLNISRSFSGFSMNVDIDANRDRYDNDSSTYNVSLQTKSRPIGKSKINFNVSGSMSKSKYEWNASTDNPYTVDTDTKRLNTNFSTSQIPIAKYIKLRSTLGFGYQWVDSTNDNNDLEGLSTIGSSVLDWKLSDRNNLQLSYRYIERPVYSRVYKDGTTVDTKPAKQSASVNWRFGNPNKWMISIYGIKGLDYPNMSVFGDLNYRLNSQWRLGLRATSNTYRTRVYENGVFVERDRSYDDLELVLGKRFGDQEIAAVWSKSDGRVLLEIGSGAF